jgi:hypothetical protein
MKPNIFNWATSELSQDAFICWIISWFNHPQEEELYQVANNLLIELTGCKISKIEKIEIKKQYKSIDILVRINDEYALLIEDKINTKDHSNQLERYIQILCYEYKKENIIPVYFKTGDQSNFESIDKAKCKIFLREDFLKILESGISLGITNNIYIDFYNHLKNIEESVQSYKKLPVSEWCWNSWKGFYTEISKRLGEGNWDYVPQKNGGFLGFWWFWNDDKYNGIEYEYYLQLEHDKFCFKIAVDNDDKNNSYAIRDYYRGKLFEKMRVHNIEIYKNGRIGKYMTVAALNEPYIKTDYKGFLDIDKTIELIEQIQKVIDEI